MKIKFRTIHTDVFRKKKKKGVNSKPANRINDDVAGMLQQQCCRGRRAIIRESGEKRGGFQERGLKECEEENGEGGEKGKIF